MLQTNVSGGKSDSTRFGPSGYVHIAVRIYSNRTTQVYMQFLWQYESKVCGGDAPSSNHPKYLIQKNSHSTSRFSQPLPNILES